MMDKQVLNKKDTSSNKEGKRNQEKAKEKEQTNKKRGMIQTRKIGRETAGRNRQSIQTQREKVVVNSCKSQYGIIGTAEEKEEAKRRQKKEDKEKEVNRKWRR